MFRKMNNRLLKYFLIRNVLINFPFEAFSWYTSNLRTSIHQILQHLRCLLSRKFSASLLFVVCMWTIFPAVCLLPVIFHKLMSNFNLCFKFCLEVIHQTFKFLWMPCSTDLGMLGQMIHYGKMRENLLRQTLNKEMWTFRDQMGARGHTLKKDMWTFRDQMWARGKLIFTHIIPDGLNRDWWL